MSHTVVGVFDTSNEAQTALQQIVSKGIDRGRIDIAPQTSSANDREEDDDSIGNFFSNLFGSDERSKKYSSYARTGSIVTVHAKTKQEAEMAADIMDEYGAVNLDERASTTATGPAARNTTSATDTTRRDTTTSDTSIPIIEEEMKVGKRTVETGGVRVRSRIIERPIEEHLRLREEHVHVERNPVNRAATPGDINSFKEGDIEITEHAEVPMVDKEARVVEEVNIGKEVDEHVEDIHGTVRKTDVEVDNLSEEELRNRRTNNAPDRPRKA